MLLLGEVTLDMEIFASLGAALKGSNLDMKIFVSLGATPEGNNS